MSFLYPTFLFALFALVIPVIIHLFNFRTYKTVYFSNVKFLKDVKKETKSKSNLKHLLILLMRLLAISSLVFAFARPYIPSGKENTQISENIIGIYIDNSFSTESESKNGKIIDIEKKKAVEIADAYPEDVKILLLTNDFELKHQHFVSKEQFKDFVLEINTGPKVKKMSSVIEKMNIVLKDEMPEIKSFTIYLISDFQKISSDIKNINTNSVDNYVFMPVLSQKTANLYIDSVWFDNPFRPLNSEDEINVRIINSSGESYTQLPVKLYINNELKSTGTFDIDAGKISDKKIKYTINKPGIINGKIEINDFPVTYDNNFYFTYNLSDTSNILIIREKNTENKFINSVFENLPFAFTKTVSVNNIKSSDIENSGVVITDGLIKISDRLKDELLSFALKGGIIIIFPSINCDINSYNDFFNSANLNYITGTDSTTVNADNLNYKSSVLKNIFKKIEKNTEMPSVSDKLNFSDITSADEEVVLYSEKNDKLISGYTYGNGKIFTFAFPANDKSGNFVFHPLWPSILYNMSFYNSAGKNIYYTAGNDFSVFVDAKNQIDEAVFHIINSDKTFDYIPQTSETAEGKYKLFVNNDIKKDGYYFIKNKDRIVSGFSLNYNRKESNLEHYSLKELKKYIDKFSDKNISVITAEKELFKEQIINKSKGIQLYKIFLLLALVFIAGEILLIKFFK